MRIIKQVFEKNTQKTTNKTLERKFIIDNASFNTILLVDFYKSSSFAHPVDIKLFIKDLD